MNVTTEKINKDLKQHQINANDWNYKDVAEGLHICSERFVLEFKLQTSLPVIQIKRLRKEAAGHLHMGRNGFGLVNEIAINEDIIELCEYWEVLGTLLHELLHAEQQNIGQAGRRNYHNRQYRDRARELGLIVDSDGFQKYVPSPSPFIDILRRHNIDIPDKPNGILPLGSGRSKLQPWICACQPRPVHAQVAIRDFRARCLKCNQLFVPKKRSNSNGTRLLHSQNEIAKTIPTGTGFTYTRLNSNKERSICKGTDYEVLKS